MPGRRWLVLLTVVPLLASCSSTPEGKPPSGLKMFLGWERFEVLLEADRVESYRLGEEDHSEGIGGRRVLSRGPDLSAEQVAGLEALFIDPDSYVFSSFKRCDPTPQVALRHVRGDETVDVILSFNCDIWQFDFRGKASIEDFDPVRPQLIELVKTLFPQDPVLQEL